MELYINLSGEINKIIILDDPGYGFAEATLSAINGIQCVPGKDEEGNPVKMHARFPVKFKMIKLKIKFNMN